MVIIAFLSAVLAGMGVGSAGFLVVYLTVFAGTPQLEAQLINLIFFISSALAAIGVNWYKKRLRWRIILTTALPGCAGAVCGSALAHSVDGNSLGRAFGILLIILGAITLMGSRKKEG
jgi:uncharacterized membrane protein YfcA